MKTIKILGLALVTILLSFAAIAIGEFGGSGLGASPSAANSLPAANTVPTVDKVDTSTADVYVPIDKANKKLLLYNDFSGTHSDPNENYYVDMEIKSNPGDSINVLKGRLAKGVGNAVYIYTEEYKDGVDTLYNIGFINIPEKYFDDQATFTVSLWYRTPKDGSALLSGSNPKAPQELLFWIPKDDAVHDFSVFYKENEYKFNIPSSLQIPSLADNDWHNIQVAFSDGVIFAYLDGVALTLAKGNPSFVKKKLDIDFVSLGLRPYFWGDVIDASFIYVDSTYAVKFKDAENVVLKSNFSAAFQGWFDELRIDDYALSAQEVQTRYKETKDPLTKNSCKFASDCKGTPPKGLKLICEKSWCTYVDGKTSSPKVKDPLTKLVEFIHGILVGKHSTPQKLDKLSLTLKSYLENDAN